MLDLIAPKEFETKDQSDKPRTYILSKFPAVQGREIVTKYPLSNIPKIGEYAVSQETMLMLMHYVGVKTTKDVVQRLSTIDLVNNHVPDWETLAGIEVAMLQYNCSFFLQERALTFLSALVEMTTAKATSILTDLSVQLFQKSKPPSTN